MSRILCTALAAGVLVGCADSGAVNKPGATAAAGSEPRQFSQFQRQVDGELSKHPGLQSLKEHFPGSYADFVSGFSPTTDTVEAERYSADWMRNFFEDNASLATGAPDAALIDWLEASVAFLQAMRRTVGPEICGKMATDHPDYVALRKKRFLKEMSHMNKTMIDALGSSLRAPTSNDPATSGDYEKFAAKILERGVDLNTVDTDVTWRTVDETFCDSGIANFQALIAGDAPSDVRVRSDLVPKLMRLSVQKSL